MAFCYGSLSRLIHPAWLGPFSPRSYGVLTLPSVPISSGTQACPLLPLVPTLPQRFLSPLRHTVLSRKRLDLVPATLVSGSSIPYLVTVGSLAQSQHLLEGLGHDVLPLIQKLLFPVTEVKAKTQVQVPRAASEGVGVGYWVTVQWRRASGQTHFHGSRQMHTPWNLPERSHGTQSPPTPAEP